MQMSLLSCGNSCTDICSGKSLSDLEYADDTVLLIEYSNKLQTFHYLNDSAGMLVMFCIKVLNAVIGLGGLKAEPCSCGETTR